MSLPNCLRHVDPQTIAAAWADPVTATILVAEVLPDFRCRLHRIQSVEMTDDLRALLTRSRQVNKLMVDTLRAMWPTPLRLVP